MFLMRLPALAWRLAWVLAVAGCGTRPIPEPQAHLRAETEAAPAAPYIPDPVASVPMPPTPQAREAEIRYSVVVANQPVRDVLLAMARETKVNFDMHPGIEGTVNLNAIDQTLKQILNRIARQVDIRWEMEGQTITVMPDTPYLRSYRVDYVNMSRDVSETVAVATSVISGGVNTGGAGAASVGSNSNNSTLTVTSTSRHRFWETLERNIKDMLRETDKLLPEGSSETFVQNRGQSASTTTQARALAARAARAGVAARGAAAGGAIETPGETQSAQASETVEQKLTFREAASVIINPETGIVSVRATSRQHEKVREFIEQVSGSSKRQVLIEATLVEVTLSDNYQTGVDWSTLALNGLGYSIRQSFQTPDLPQFPSQLTNSFLSLTYNNPNAASGGSISSTIKLLDAFGKTRVLSSPKLMVLNNQTASLKVVDNRVYFTIKSDTIANVNSPTVTNFTTTQNVVPVGFIMNVTPQISDGDMVTLNVRPTVTRIIDTVNDPASPVGRPSVIPVTQTREMESVLKVSSGQTAILGGLMIDAFQGRRDGLPIASRIPIIGDFFSSRNDVASKSELVIFIRALVIRDASVEGDLAAYQRYLPSDAFFRDTRTPFPCVETGLVRAEEWALRGGDNPCKAPAAPVVAEPPRSPQ
jgi:general secretion pathway protein D